MPIYLPLNLLISHNLPPRRWKMSDIISDVGRELSETINFVVISFTVGIFGIAGNIINTIIFCKQGFGNTVNIAFLGLSVSDLCCLLFLVWFCICMNPLFVGSGVPWVPFDVAFLSGSWLHVCFCRTTSYITIYITTERYLSIAFPLKVKQFVTGKKTTLVIGTIYLVNISALAPEYISSELGWKFIPKLNTTLIGVIHNSKRKRVEGIENVLHSTLSAASFFGVVIATVALVMKLKEASKWRQEMRSQRINHQTISAREQKMVKMVVLIACVMIVCYTPGVVISFTTYIIGPEFNILGKYFNSCIVMWTIAYTFQTINSSINIFLYYNMSSNYKRTFHGLFSNSWRNLSEV